MGNRLLKTRWRARDTVCLSAAHAVHSARSWRGGREGILRCRMWDEIEKRGRRYLELKRLVEDPASPGKPQYPAWLREFGRLAKFGALYDEYRAAEKAVQEAEAILEDPAAEAEFKGLLDIQSHHLRPENRPRIPARVKEPPEVH